MDLQSIVRQGYGEMKEGKHLERCLWYLAKLREYSLANTILLIKQTQGRVRYAQGAAEWNKRFQTTITPSAKPLHIYAPLNEGKDFSIIKVFDVSDTEMGGEGPAFRPRIKTTALVNEFAKSQGISLVVSLQQKEPMKFSAVDNRVSINCSDAEKTFHALKGICLILLERNKKKGWFKGDLTKAAAIACAFAFEVRCFLQEIEGTQLPEAARKAILSDIKGVLNESHRMARKAMDKIEELQVSQRR